MSGSRSGVLVDLDGTLLDTTYLHTVAWWRALEEAGEPRPMAVVHRLIGMGSAELLTTLLGRDSSDISAAHGRYFAEMYSEVRALPGASELIEQISARGGMVVLVTSAKKRDLANLLGNLRARDRIDLIVEGEDADRAKPHPDLFSLALERSCLPRSSAIALGDAEWDVHAAARVGIGCVGVMTGGISEGELRSAGALAVYDSCADLLVHWNASPFADLLS